MESVIHEDLTLCSGGSDEEGEDDSKTMSISEDYTDIAEVRVVRVVKACVVLCS